MRYRDYFDDLVLGTIVDALRAAYDRNMLAFDAEIGNTSVSFGVSTWQSSLFFLERGFGSVIDAQVHRSGSVFYITLPSCRLSFFKFGVSSEDDAGSFRLDGQRSRTRKLIVQTNQLSLFGFTMDRSAEPVSVPEIVVIHSGNFLDGLLEVHIGAPISSESSEDGWLWLDQVYRRHEESGSSDIHFTAPTRPAQTTTAFRDMPQPTISVEGLPNERVAREREDKT